VLAPSPATRSLALEPMIGPDHKLAVGIAHDRDDLGLRGPEGGRGAQPDEALAVRDDGVGAPAGPSSPSAERAVSLRRRRRWSLPIEAEMSGDRPGRSPVDPAFVLTIRALIGIEDPTWVSVDPHFLESF
jgi:hypothetical protein